MIDCPQCHRQFSGSDQRCPHCGAWLADAPQTGLSDLEERIQALLDQGQKIDAIKLYREHTGAGLADAKDAVEAIQSHQKFSSVLSTDGDMQEKILDLMRKNEKIAAIKVLREHKKCGLKEAKDYVENLAAQHGIPVTKGAGCLTAAVFMVFILCGLAGIWKLIA